MSAPDAPPDDRAADATWPDGPRLTRRAALALMSASAVAVQAAAADRPVPRPVDLDRPADDGQGRVFVEGVFEDDVFV